MLASFCEPRSRSRVCLPFEVSRCGVIVVVLCSRKNLAEGGLKEVSPPIATKLSQYCARKMNNCCCWKATQGPSGGSTFLQFSFFLVARELVTRGQRETGNKLKATLACGLFAQVRQTRPANFLLPEREGGSRSFSISGAASYGHAAVIRA